jgi:hypothetical protein
VLKAILGNLLKPYPGRWRQTKCLGINGQQTGIFGQIVKKAPTLGITVRCERSDTLA